MVLGLCALFISPTLVALSLTDILILHAFNAKKLFIKRQLMFIRGKTLRLQHVYVAHALCIGSLHMPGQGAISTMQLAICMCVCALGIGNRYWNYLLAAIARCLGTLHWH